MLIRQLCKPRSAVVSNNTGGRLFTIELPPQAFGYDVKKDEGVWYEVEFLFTPGTALSAPNPIKGSASIRDFCEVGGAVDDLHRKSAKYLHDDSDLSVRENLKGFNNSSVAVFYRDGRPWFHLKLLGVELEESPWTPELFEQLRELADGYQAERGAFEAKMKAKVEREGKSEN